MLVAHSRGGLQTTQAAEERPEKIRALVYLAAFLLPSGARLLDWKDSDSILWPKVEFNEQEGWDMIRPEIYRESIYADCSNEDIALAYALLTPEPRERTAGSPRGRGPPARSGRTRAGSEAPAP